MAKDNIISVMKRYELKFHLTKKQVERFKTRILEHMEIDRYGQTTISSLYFDTPSFSLINRSIEKPLFKEKIRLRSYGLASKTSPVFLEIKRKNEKIVYKRRIATSEEEAEEFLATGEGLEESQISRELEAFLESHGKLEAKYLVIYDRIAYFQKDSDVRITLDQNPRYRVEDLNLHTSNEGIPLLGEGEAILEVKIQHSIPLWLAQILTEEKVYPTSLSKVGTAHKKEMSQRKDDAVAFAHHMNSQTQRRYQYGFTI